MDPAARVSYLRNPPDSRLFSRRVARIRQKGFHAESKPGEGNELDASAVYLVSPGSDPIIGLRPWGDGVPTWIRDATANDSSKDFTVPTGKRWHLKCVNALLATTATVGNRVLRVTIRSPTTEMYVSPYSASLVASASYNYAWAPACAALSGASANSTICIPDFILPEGYIVRVEDTAAIDPAADDLTVVLHYVEYDA